MSRSLRTPPGPLGQPLRTTRRFTNDPLTFLSGLEASYPDLASFRYGPVTLTLVTDPDAAFRVLQETEGRFAKADVTGDDVGDLLGSGLLLSSGEQWREHRALMDSWFARDAVESYVDVMRAETLNAVDSWTEGESVDLEAVMSELTVSVLTETVFGVSLSDESLTRLRHALEPLAARFEPDPLREVVPNWLPTPGEREFRESVAAIEDVVDEIVAERRRTAGDDRERLLDALLAAFDDGSLSESELRDEMVTLLLAGHDTTALTLSYALYLLAKHPDEMAVVREEVDALDGPITPGDANGLSVTRRTIQETLRLYPPAWLLIRQAPESTKLAGYRLPDGARLMISPYVLQRSSRWYENPDAFQPSRWADESSRPAGAYLPFGAGPRTCIGKQFALMEATVVLATLLRRVEFADPPASVEVQPTLTLHARDPPTLTVSHRQ